MLTPENTGWQEMEELKIYGRHQAPKDSLLGTQRLASKSKS